jgi:hypothetical protein
VAVTEHEGGNVVPDDKRVRVDIIQKEMNEAKKKFVPLFAKLSDIATSCKDKACNTVVDQLTQEKTMPLLDVLDSAVTLSAGFLSAGLHAWHSFALDDLLDQVGMFDTDKGKARKFPDDSLKVTLKQNAKAFEDFLKDFGDLPIQVIEPCFDDVAGNRATGLRVVLQHCTKVKEVFTEACLLYVDRLMYKHSKLPVQPVNCDKLRAMLARMGEDPLRDNI